VLDVNANTFAHDWKFIWAMAQAKTDERVIRFPGSAKPIFSQTALNLFVLVRECYKELLGKIWEEAMDNGRMQIAVIGSEGVGKSYFAAYLAIRARDEGFWVLLDMQSSEWPDDSTTGAYMYLLTNNAVGGNKVVKALRRQGKTRK